MNYFINIRDFIYYHRKYFIGGLVLIILFSMYFIYSANNKEESINDVELVKEEIVEEKSEVNTLFVDIKGEVPNPGLYEVDSSKRVMDVIILAGGLSLDADTSNINLSMKVTDEMVIIIPKKDENNESNYVINNDAGISTKSSSEAKKSGKVSINSATLEELMGVSGIGEVKAKRIIEYRNTHGKYNSIDELTNVSGIGAKTLEKIKDYLTL